MAIIDDTKIADDKQQETVLKGIQPRRQKMFAAFKACRFIGIMLLILSAGMFAVTFIENFKKITGKPAFRWSVLILALAGLFCLFMMLMIRILFLRKAPFDDWVFEIAQKRLGTEVIFYDGKRIYISYDRGGKEVDKREFVTEMSDKSVHYSYFYKDTDIDQGYIIVECKERAPIPEMASFSPEDDKYWNIIPMGLTINNNTQKIAPVGWYLNDQNMNPDLKETIPSTSMLIAGGTGCYAKNTPILMYDTLVH